MITPSSRRKWSNDGVIIQTFVIIVGEEGGGGGREREKSSITNCMLFPF